MFSEINNPCSNEYLTNFQEYNQLNDGNISINLDESNFNQDKNNLDQRLKTSANFYNYGNGQIQLQGSAVVSAETPSSKFLIGELPPKFKPKFTVKYAVPYDRSGTLGTNFISILSGTSPSQIILENAPNFGDIIYLDGLPLLVDKFY